MIIRTSEKAKFVHLGLTKGHDGVVVLGRILHQKSVGPVLLLQDGCGQLLGCTAAAHLVDFC